MAWIFVVEKFEVECYSLDISTAILDFENLDILKKVPFPRWTVTIWGSPGLPSSQPPTSRRGQSWSGITIMRFAFLKIWSSWCLQQGGVSSGEENRLLLRGGGVQGETSLTRKRLLEPIMLCLSLSLFWYRLQRQDYINWVNSTKITHFCKSSPRCQCISSRVEQVIAWIYTVGILWKAEQFLIICILMVYFTIWHTVVQMNRFCFDMNPPGTQCRK